MIQRDIELKNFANYKIGGKAKYFLEIKSLDDLKNGLKEWQKTGENFPFFVLGSGTNILFSDSGFNGLIIRNSINFIEDENDIVEVGAGVLVSDFLNFCMGKDLSGFEWAGGLPGTVGGALYGNAGAFGKETKDLVLEVKSFDIEKNKEILRTNSECEFSYRDSVFKRRPNEIIISAKLKLDYNSKDKIQKEIEEKIDYRKEHQPLDLPSAGSTFKNVPLEKIPEKYQTLWQAKIKNDPFPLVPVAVILSRAGLKGRKVGDAQISPKHPNFFVNTGSASAEDVRNLISLAKKEVKAKFQIDLEEEIIIK